MRILVKRFKEGVLCERFIVKNETKIKHYSEMSKRYQSTNPKNGYFIEELK